MLKKNQPPVKRKLSSIKAEDFTSGPKSLEGDDENEETTSKMAEKEKKKDKNKNVDINEMKWDSDVPEIH